MAKTPLPELRENGSRRRPPQGWKAFYEEAAKAKPPIKRPNLSPAQLANLKPKMGRVHYKTFCVATSRSGERCRCAPVRGAERCVTHGGMLEVPHHPGNARHRHREARAAAREAFYAYDKATRATVTKAAPGRRAERWATLLEGAQALHADETGAAFRRWLANLRTT